uniref:MADF domain-containing protein n=1 Tax=Sparus aurata TaxID=8175 RepID=A0A671U0P7_SPAAU
TMDEKLIIAVSGFPELYDASLFVYRDNRRKNEAWRKVSDVVGLSVDDCRKRWKNVRDTHRRERKKEKERCRSGAEASTSRPWHYSQIMAFLNPFMEDRATTSNFPVEGEGEDIFTLFFEPESLSPFERQLMGAVEKAVTQTAPPDPDRQFFEGLLPDLKALSARRRADVKFQIHKIIFDATCQEFAEKEQS